jgi:hypothetical protein
MNGDPRILVDDTVFQELLRKLDSEGVRAAATTLSGFAALVLPVLPVEESNVNAPNRSNPADFQPFSLVDCVAPNNVPSRVIEVRLQRPWACRSLGFQCVLRRWV